jgi:redox-sensitive bicupin YhaK (pirin superfamily)
VITVRRSDQRRVESSPKLSAWLTYDARQRSDPLVEVFGPLVLISEVRLAPGASVEHLAPREGEVLTFLQQGALSISDTAGHVGLLLCGEVQRLGAASGLRQRQTNTSPTDHACLFQVWLRPPESGLAPGREQRRFTTAQRRGLPCLVASPDGRRGSLRVHQDARLYAALLAPGQHIVHPLEQGRVAWVQVLEGRVRLNELVLVAGDGAGISSERAVSLTALEASEVLLIDLGRGTALARTGSGP